MDTKSLLESLEQDIEKLESEYLSLKEQAVDFDGTPEYSEYMAIINTEGTSKEAIAVVLQEKFPKQYEMYEKMAKLEEKHAAFFEVAKSTATKLYGEITVSLERIEKRIETAKEFLEELDKEIEAKKQEVEDIRASKEYKEGDERTLLVAGKMEKELKALLEDKSEVSKKIEGLTKAVERLKAEQEALIDNYGEDVRQASVTPEQEDSDKNPEEQNQNPDSPEKDKPIYNNIVVPDEDNLTPEEKAQKEFDDLCTKAKEGKLSADEFDRLSAIMQNPESYDTFNITTGLVFNKARKIAKYMDKNTKSSNQLLKAIDLNFKSGKINIWKMSEKEAFATLLAMDRESLTEEQQAVYDNVKRKHSITNIKEVAKDVNKERTLKKYSWLLEEKEKPAPLPVANGQDNPAAGGTQPNKGRTILDDLNNQTVPPEEQPEVIDSPKPEKNNPEQVK